MAKIASSTKYSRQRAAHYDEPSKVKVATATTIGTTIEYYDFLFTARQLPWYFPWFSSPHWDRLRDLPHLLLPSLSRFLHGR